MSPGGDFGEQVSQAAEIAAHLQQTKKPCSQWTAVCPWQSTAVSLVCYFFPAPVRIAAPPFSRFTLSSPHDPAVR